jgi:hypothetical protein
VPGTEKLQAELELEAARLGVIKPGKPDVHLRGGGAGPGPLSPPPPRVAPSESSQALPTHPAQPTPPPSGRDVVPFVCHFSASASVGISPDSSGPTKLWLCIRAG